MFHVQWTENLSKIGLRIKNKTAILQLCVNTKCLILQLLFIDYIPQSVKHFLSNPNLSFVGVEVQRDVTKLRNEYGLQFTNIAAVRDETLKRFPSMFNGKPGLKDVANRIVGLDMPKPEHVSQSNWEARVLDDKQIEYATIDAYASFKIGHKQMMEI